MTNWRMSVQGGLHDGAVIDLPEGQYGLGKDAGQVQIVLSDPELSACVLELQVSAARVILTLPSSATAAGLSDRSVPPGALPLEIKVAGRVLSRRGKVIMASAAPLGQAAIVQLTPHISLHLSADGVVLKKKTSKRPNIYGLGLVGLVLGGGAWWYGAFASVSASTPGELLPMEIPPVVPTSVISTNTTDFVPDTPTEPITSDTSPVLEKTETVEELPVVEKAEKKTIAVPKPTTQEKQLVGSMGSYMALGVVSVGSMDFQGGASTGRQWYLELADRTRVYEGGRLPTGQVFLSVDKRQRLWVTLSDGRRVFYSLQ